MNIGIIGGGAIGLLFASYLSKKAEVTVYTKTQQQAEELTKNGILLIKNDQSAIYRVNARQISEWDSHEDLTIVAVKQYQLASVLKVFHEASELNSLMFLQNGMGHLKSLTNLHAKNLFVGSVEHGAGKVNNYTVRHNGEGVTNVAVFKGDSEVLTYLSAIMSGAFPFVFKKDYYEMLVNKLVINAVVNPLTAILKTENGQLVGNPFYYDIVQTLFSEIVMILNLSDDEAYFQRVIEICRQTAANRSSMLKDIETGQETEVEAIIGFLLDEAAKQGKKAPLATMCYQLIKGMELENKIRDNAGN